MCLFKSDHILREGSQEFSYFLRHTRSTEPPIAKNSTKRDSGAGCVLTDCGIVCVVEIDGILVICTGSVTVAFPHLLKNSTLPDVPAAK